MCRDGSVEKSDRGAIHRNTVTHCHVWTAPCWQVRFAYVAGGKAAQYHGRVRYSGLVAALAVADGTGVSPRIPWSHLETAIRAGPCGRASARTDGNNVEPSGRDELLCDQPVASAIFTMVFPSRGLNLREESDES